MGMNRALSEFQRHNLITHSGARLMLTDVPFDITSRTGSKTQVKVIRMSTEDDEWRDRIAAASTARRKTLDVDPLAPAAIAYTSGTSGSPKGVVHSQHNITLPGRFLATTPDFDSSAIGGVCLALTILNVIAVSVLPSIIAQRPCVILPRPDPTLIAAGVERHRITSISMPPPTLFDLVHRSDISPSSLRTLRYPRTGGAELPEEVRQGYSRSASGVTSRPHTASPNFPPSSRWSGAAYPMCRGSSGHVLPYLEVSIIGDDGQELPPGETGEICVRASTHGPWGGTYRPMLGYWRRPAATRKTLSGGMLHTGDIGSVVDGMLFPKDRRDNLILRGGASVYPAQVERVIRSLPGVADCAVVGLPDPRLGQRVGVAIERDENATLAAEDVLGHCQRHLARYEVPESVVFVAALPRNTMNKVVRRTVLEQMQSVMREGADATGEVRGERIQTTGA